MKKPFAIFARNFLGPLIEKFIEEVKGKENIPKDTNFILAPNHQSYFDHFFVPFPIVDRLEKIRFIGKMDSRWQALQWAWFYWLAETIPINRKAEDKRKVLDIALEVLKGGGIIVIYPEGKRNKEKELLEGKTGVAELAVRSGKPVIPLGLIYKDNHPPQLPVRINIGQPLYFKRNDDNQNLKEITDKIMREIAKLSEKIYPY
jgi:1-acyl-sn-glycerol-3-phosphate acyltransferase